MYVLKVCRYIETNMVYVIYASHAYSHITLHIQYARVFIVCVLRMKCGAALRIFTATQHFFCLPSLWCCYDCSIAIHWRKDQTKRTQNCWTIYFFVSLLWYNLVVTIINLGPKFMITKNILYFEISHGGQVSRDPHIWHVRVVVIRAEKRKYIYI